MGENDKSTLSSSSSGAPTDDLRQGDTTSGPEQFDARAPPPNSSDQVPKDVSEDAPPDASRATSPETSGVEVGGMPDQAAVPHELSDSTGDGLALAEGPQREGSTEGEQTARQAESPTPRVSMQLNGTHIQTSESALEGAPEDKATASKTSAMSAPPPALRKTSVPSFTDTKSLATRSIGDRSVAMSTLSPEDEALSFRVRSLYDSGVGVASDASSQLSADNTQKQIPSIVEERSAALNKRSHVRSSFPGAIGKDHSRRTLSRGSLDDSEFSRRRQLSPGASSSKRLSSCGAIEDWKDLEGVEVDRYGFINHTYISSTAPGPPDPRLVPKRVATALLRSSEAPRSRTLRRLRLSPPAEDMLHSPDNPKNMREKEDKRSRKWKEMAVPSKRPEKGAEGAKGGGLEWSFAIKDPKVISRTWKGIPDCWRAAAWHAFLTAGAKLRGIGQSDADLTAVYQELLERPSADDVQIDLDVPRTVNAHVMFRRRYSGGQRLLFRVLHCLALYFPEVGYVQGMAGLAATLLCYYDEETAFIMLVRLWQLRGLEQLYKSGFGGLMAALSEFEAEWMKGNPIDRKLKRLGITATAYGTRWYLTLFNYSIPFAAQLRVWDVFMLLGDPYPGSKSEFGGTLDVLHATSAALLDGMKSIILKSDFEEAMKNLTSFIPVKDEDMLMKVVKAEWKTKKRK